MEQRKPPNQTQKVFHNLNSVQERNSREPDLNQSGRPATGTFCPFPERHIFKPNGSRKQWWKTQYDFTLGDLRGASFCQQISTAFCEVVLLRGISSLLQQEKNWPSLPNFTDASTLECIALKAAPSYNVDYNKSHMLEANPKNTLHIWKDRMMIPRQKGENTTLLQEGKVYSKSSSSTYQSSGQLGEKSRIFTRA